MTSYKAKSLEQAITIEILQAKIDVLSDLLDLRGQMIETLSKTIEDIEIMRGGGLHESKK